MKINSLIWKQDTLRFNCIDEIKVKCQYCGHVNAIPVFKDNEICSLCHNKINNNTKAYFKYKVRKLINKEC